MQARVTNRSIYVPMFQIVRVPFLTVGLGDFLSPEALDLHVNKHHKSYVDAANKLLSSEGDPKYAEFRGKTLEEIIKTAKGPLFNNCSQHFHHSFFWLCLTNNKEHNVPSSKVTSFLQDRFGSIDKFKEEFISKASTIFGSGWCYFVLFRNEKGQFVVEIKQYQNAENPISNGEYPILCIDVWEHAWYADYKNRKMDYFGKFFGYVNWIFVEQRLRMAKLIN